MAFFKKLKDRLFRSSSKLEDGLDERARQGWRVSAFAAEQCKREQ